MDPSTGRRSEVPPADAGLRARLAMPSTVPRGARLFGVPHDLRHLPDRVADAHVGCTARPGSMRRTLARWLLCRRDRDQLTRWRVDHVEQAAEGRPGAQGPAQPIVGQSEEGHARPRWPRGTACCVRSTRVLPKPRSMPVRSNGADEMRCRCASAPEACRARRSRPPHRSRQRQRRRSHRLVWRSPRRAAAALLGPLRTAATAAGKSATFRIVPCTTEVAGPVDELGRAAARRGARPEPGTERQHRPDPYPDPTHDRSRPLMPTSPRNSRDAST